MYVIYFCEVHGLSPYLLSPVKGSIGLALFHGLTTCIFPPSIGACVGEVQKEDRVQIRFK